MGLIGQIQAGLSAIGFGWFDAKMFVERSLAFDSDALHVMTGVVLQLVVAGLLRRSLGQWGPWLAVLGLELANETVDLWIERWPDIAMQLGEGFKDILLTLALPTLLLVVARQFPRLLRG